MMTLRPIIASIGILAVLALVKTDVGLAQEIEDAGQVYPYAYETKQERAERLEKAQARTREFIARAKAGMLSAPDAEQIAKGQAEIASDSVISDSTLQPGDIISTTKGLFVFRGPLDRDHRPEDFVPLLEDIKRPLQRRQ